jgi:hypothetical protein
VLTAATDVGANSILRQPTDGGTVLTDAIANGFTSGFLTFLPGVRGLRPQSIWSAHDLTKAHAARSSCVWYKHANVWRSRLSADELGSYRLGIKVRW